MSAIFTASTAQSSVEPCIIHRASIHKYLIFYFLQIVTLSCSAKGRSDCENPSKRGRIVEVVVCHS